MRRAGLEPARPQRASGPKPGASTNFAIPAHEGSILQKNSEKCLQKSCADLKNQSRSQGGVTWLRASRNRSRRCSRLPHARDGDHRSRIHPLHARGDGRRSSTRLLHDRGDDRRSRIRPLHAHGDGRRSRTRTLPLRDRGGDRRSRSRSFLRSRDFRRSRSRCRSRSRSHCCSRSTGQK